jgi:hypothetical protein
MAAAACRRTALSGVLSPTPCSPKAQGVADGARATRRTPPPCLLGQPGARGPPASGPQRARLAARGRGPPPPAGALKPAVSALNLDPRCGRARRGAPPDQRGGFRSRAQIDPLVRQTRAPRPPPAPPPFIHSIRVSIRPAATTYARRGTLRRGPGWRRRGRRHRCWATTWAQKARRLARRRAAGPARCSWRWWTMISPRWRPCSARAPSRVCGRPDRPRGVAGSRAAGRRRRATASHPCSPARAPHPAPAPPAPRRRGAPGAVLGHGSRSAHGCAGQGSGGLGVPGAGRRPHPAPARVVPRLPALRQPAPGARGQPWAAIRGRADGVRRERARAGGGGRLRALPRPPAPPPRPAPGAAPAGPAGPPAAGAGPHARPPRPPHAPAAPPPPAPPDNQPQPTPQARTPQARTPQARTPHPRAPRAPAPTPSVRRRERQPQRPHAARHP